MLSGRCRKYSFIASALGEVGNSLAPFPFEPANRNVPGRPHGRFDSTTRPLTLASEPSTPAAPYPRQAVDYGSVDGLTIVSLPFHGVMENPGITRFSVRALFICGSGAWLGPTQP